LVIAQVVKQYAGRAVTGTIHGLVYGNRHVVLGADPTLFKP
jgi:hypothetical protein